MSEDLEIINQNTKIEKFKNFFSNNLRKIIVVLILILLFIFSYFGYQEYKKLQKKEIAKQYNQITLKNITTENIGEIQKLVEIIKKRDPVYSTLSLNFIIENNLVDDNNDVNSFFDIVIKSQKDKEIRNLIIYKKALYNSEIASENELLEILNPLLKSESVWKSHALLLMSDYFANKNNLIKSKEFLGEIVNSKIIINNDIKIEAERRLKRDFSD